MPIKHVSVGAELNQTEWEDEETHTIDGTLDLNSQEITGMGVSMQKGAGVTNSHLYIHAGPTGEGEGRGAIILITGKDSAFPNYESGCFAVFTPNAALDLDSPRFRISGSVDEAEVKFTNCHVIHTGTGNLYGGIQSTSAGAASFYLLPESEDTYIATFTNRSIHFGHAATLGGSVTEKLGLNCQTGVLTLFGYLDLWSTDIDSSQTGQIWYDASENVIKYYNGSAVKTVATV